MDCINTSNYHNSPCLADDELFGQFVNLPVAVDDTDPHSFLTQTLEPLQDDVALPDDLVHTSFDLNLNGDLNLDRSANELVHNSMTPDEFTSQPQYQPMDHATGSKERHSYIEGCGILRIGKSDFVTQSRKRRRSVEEKVASGRACLLCKWKKSKCSDGCSNGLICHECAKAIKRSQQRSALFWNQCTRADVSSFNVFVPDGLDYATLASDGGTYKLKRGSFSARFDRFLGYNFTPQSPGYCQLRLLQLNVIADISSFDETWVETSLSRFRPIAIFKRASHLLSKLKVGDRLSHAAPDHLTYLSPRDYLEALAPDARSTIEGYRAHASVQMVELLEDFVRAHATVSQEQRMPCTGFMIVVASVLYCGLIESILPRHCDQQTESQQFLGDYLLHSLKIFCRYAFPSAECLLRELRNVRTGDQLPVTFGDALAIQLDSVSDQSAGSVHAFLINEYLTDRRSCATDHTNHTHLDHSHRDPPPAAATNPVELVYSMIPSYYTQAFNISSAELSALAEALNMEVHTLSEQPSGSGRSSGAHRVFMRCIVDAGVEIIAHERQLHRLQRDSTGQGNNRQRLPVMRFGETTESDWACSMLTLGLIFRIFLLHCLVEGGFIPCARFQDVWLNPTTNVPEWLEIQIRVGLPLLYANRQIWAKWSRHASEVIKEMERSG
ncbi:hypothetical protein Z517_07598 [Fonsecaea pedrosoi CBS 271.37]|uniref:Unplaced genomic scaffold supercont1.5, whole genome shotgun sequence n=1 Tax=Fonsecaea pedrosoi CBS 271.37 TaxID=1442368 RepID=A0A0D2GGL4_9EURO|nr:uncharacterized protein Z517_07598 [Fonsecaea pedrosoi CBS 271.37]KIW77765.1 hypothetical protein Z517_07598 [Fonsecaea pedrosoi CBS 271.37]